MTEGHGTLTATIILQWGNDAAAGETVPEETATSETRTDCLAKPESIRQSVIETAPAPPPAPAANTVGDDARNRAQPASVVRKQSPARERLLPSERLILDYLRENLETDDTTCHVKQRDIAAACGVSWRTVQVALQRLAARHLVAQLEQRAGLQAGCRYRLQPLPARDNLFHITARQRG